MCNRRECLIIINVIGSYEGTNEVGLSFIPTALVKETVAMPTSFNQHGYGDKDATKKILQTCCGTKKKTKKKKEKEEEEFICCTRLFLIPCNEIYEFEMENLGK